MRAALRLLLPLSLVACPAPPELRCDGASCRDLAALEDLAAAPDQGGQGAADAAGAEGPARDLRAAPSDPGRPGPRRVLRFDLRVPITPTATLETTVLGPTDDDLTLSRGGAPYPLVVISPGFTLPRAQFAGYGERLASHGFLAVLQSARAEGNHAQYRDDTVRLLDWLLSPSGPEAERLRGRIDGALIGLVGHSLGGKISLLVAGRDPRVKAVMGIDPVDSGVGMQPSAKDALAGLRLPAGAAIGFLGETVSKAGAIPCAPSQQNYEALYQAAPAPAFAITFIGAAHNDFVDDFASCAFCGVCGGGTAPKSRTRDLAVKYVAAYFLKALKGVSGAEEHLSGAPFEADRAAGAVTRLSK